ncbi:putative like subfamily A member 5 [Rosellinia necatrix]|uniref:Putative like subfamily A member 5 n=1 Tax=Rosellinia necatrix TaxID=77044 RepID=A0A1W2TN83_ROSNE|nr:putative like subfamily A member 5 [Rosellinia necatrix]
MGAEQSSTRGTASPNSAPKKTDYYQLLGVDRTATDDEIKKAYRKKALELHPDRNFGNVDEATRKFAEVQSAYEVLADPQERAWYDSHSDAILRGDDPADFDAAPEYRNVRLTTTDDIYTLMGRFNKSVPFDDSPTSFFTILRETFDRLAEGENAAADWEGLALTEYPSFGESTDDGTVAKAFYTSWSNFTTRLSFSWKDKWRLSDAPDRRVRRLMEKENKKLREDAMREFNDAVRSLVIFVRKRDPRYVPNSQSEAERQKILRDSAAAQAARSRAANQEKMNRAAAVPEWAQSRGDDVHTDEFSESEVESEVEEIECVVCSKRFKSEKQFEAHEKSKKHLKAVQQLKRAMKKEDAKFDLSDVAEPGPTTSADGLATEGDATTRTPRSPQGSRSPLEASSRTDADPADPVASGPTAPKSDAESEDDEYASRDAVEARLAGKPSAPTLDEGDSIEVAVTKMKEIAVDDKPPAKKIGMAKAKKQKKAARQATAEKEGHPCITCRAPFDSKGGLFQHIKENPGHAAPRSALPTVKPGGRKR